MFPQRFDSHGWAKVGFPLSPDEHGEVCVKYGVTVTIRKAARVLGQPLVDPGGLYLHSGHALRVTGAQALSRAGLSEHTISPRARWGSAPVQNYMRKAPLPASHHLAAVVLKSVEAECGVGFRGSDRRVLLPACRGLQEVSSYETEKTGRAAVE